MSNANAKSRPHGGYGISKAVSSEQTNKTRLPAENRLLLLYLVYSLSVPIR
jgi:hypothetical protein